MLYKKPNNLKYTDMCIWVDNLVKRGNPTEAELEQAFQYVYHIMFMLAHKHKYFNHNYYYEEFAVYSATNIINRLFLNPRLGKLDENGEPVLPPVKSVLNYAKAAIYGMKVNFEQEFYCQKIFNSNSAVHEELTLGEQLLSASGQREVDLRIYLSQLDRTVKHLIYKNNFYKSDKFLMKNIYVSCLLTILNSLTFTEGMLKELELKYSTAGSKYNFMCRQFRENRKNSLILYHLDDSYEDYIQVLTNKVLRVVSTDMKELIYSTPIVSDDVLSEILFSELDGKTVENDY